MPRHNATTRTITMDAHVSTMETTITNLSTRLVNAVNSSVHFAVSNAFTTQLSSALEHCLLVYFEQFRREIAACGEGEGSSTLGFIDHSPARDLDQIQFPSNPNETSGGQTHQPPWAIWVDFPHFTKGEYPLAWIYKDD